MSLHICVCVCAQACVRAHMYILCLSTVKFPFKFCLMENHLTLNKEIFKWGLYTIKKIDTHLLIACIYFNLTKMNKYLLSIFYIGAHCSIVGWGPMLQARKSRVWFPMRSLDFFNLPNPSSRTMALGLTQPLTELSNRNLLGGGGGGRPPGPKG
jgi:hypothetical protein